MNQYIIFTNKSDADSFVASTDSLLGYPEPLEKFSQAGGGIYAPIELGRAMHYCTPEPNQHNDAWMVPYTGCVSLPESASAVDELPSDWYPQE